MPELPEVETIRGDLQSLIVGREIISVHVLLPKLLRGSSKQEFESRLKGCRFTGVGRRAKIIILTLSSGDCLLVHLKMSGRLVYLPVEVEREKHTHVIFALDNDYELRFVDMRQFGYIKLVDGCLLDQVSEIAGLGPEPLDQSFSEAVFARMIEEKKKSRRVIKALLIDQKFIAGIGNIYADEILHTSGIHPERQLASLSKRETESLYLAIISTLKVAIEFRGTTFDRYVDAVGRTGNYLEELRVYGRGGERCRECGSTIEKKKIAGRGTNFCPRCQKLAR